MKARSSDKAWQYALQVFKTLKRRSFPRLCHIDDCCGRETLCNFSLSIRSALCRAHLQGSHCHFPLLQR